MSELVRPEHAERVRDFYRNQGAIKERERIVALLQERTMKLETEVSDGCGWSFGRHEEIVFITKLIKGENK
jgi:hypothetical protein